METLILNFYVMRLQSFFGFYFKNKGNSMKSFKKNKIKFVLLKGYCSCRIENVLDGDKSGYKEISGKVILIILVRCEGVFRQGGGMGREQIGMKII